MLDKEVCTVLREDEGASLQKELYLSRLEVEAQGARRALGTLMCSGVKRERKVPAWALENGNYRGVLSGSSNVTKCTAQKVYSHLWG